MSDVELMSSDYLQATVPSISVKQECHLLCTLIPVSDGDLILGAESMRDVLHRFNNSVFNIKIVCDNLINFPDRFRLR